MSSAAASATAEAANASSSASTGTTSATGGSAAAAAAAGGAAAGGAAGGAGAGVSDDTIVTNFDIAILILLAVFLVLVLPRRIARFRSKSQSRLGFFLRAGSNASSPAFSPAANSGGALRRWNTNATAVGSSDYAHDNYKGAQSQEYLNPGGYRAPASSNPPPHFPKLQTLLHPLSDFINIPVPLLGGYSVGKLFLMAAYLAGILTIVFIVDGNPMGNPVRLGWIATSQIPIIVGLAIKSTPAGIVSGLGYEKINYLHRWTGTVITFVATAHGVGYLYKYAINAELAQEVQTALVRNGLIALGGIWSLYASARPSLRAAHYPLFLTTHLGGMALFFVGLVNHQPEAATIFVGIALALYFKDILIYRLLRTRIATARITQVPELGLTRVEVPAIGTGWRAGQHVRVRILSAEMGLTNVVMPGTAHPFTVACAPGKGDGKGLVLMCKKAGRWTRALYDLAGAQSGGHSLESGHGGGIAREVKVAIDGPYGGPGDTVPASYTAAVLVAGGSGITFTLGHAEALADAIRRGEATTRFVEVVWVVQERDALAPMLPAFTSLIQALEHVPGVVLHIAVHYTRAGKAKMPRGMKGGPLKSGFSPTTPEGFRPAKGESFVPGLHRSNSNASGTELEEAHLATLAPHLTLSAGRPNLGAILSNTARLGSAVANAHGMVVGVCGPAGLVNQIGGEVRRLESGLRSAVGGVEVMEEVFGW